MSYRKLYCPECSAYLEGGDGECHDCACGWKQYQPIDNDGGDQELKP